MSEPPSASGAVTLSRSEVCTFVRLSSMTTAPFKTGVLLKVSVPMDAPGAMTPLLVSVPLTEPKPDNVCAAPSVKPPATPETSNSAPAATAMFALASVTEAPLKASVPPPTVVVPVKVFAPVNVRIPLPVLVNASEPAVFWMTPPKLLETLLLPTVSSGLPPATVSITPAPLKPLTVSLNVFKSSVALTETLPLPAPSGMTLPAPSRSTPALARVSPL